MEKEPEKKSTRVRYDRLRAIELEMQGIWEETPEQYIYQDADPEYMSKSLEEKNESKYMCTFPYPYMNGYLHLGHGFSMSKAEFAVRYQRQRGKKALFPFGFHCTGMPIQAAANRLKMEIESGKTRSVQPEAPKVEAPKPEEPKADDAKKGGKAGKAKKEKVVEVKKVPPTQYEILLQIGIPEEDIPLFKDSMHWLKFFPPQGQKDLKAFGVSADWRRSFITTSVNPFYDSFI
jgi:leucyl-tRNA synthetase